MGSGRTGTHWVGSSFARAGDMVVGEGHGGFEQSVRCALGLDAPDALVDAYRDSLRTTKGPIAFKWHPSLWSATTLLDAIPELLVVATRRDVLATTRSMYQHQGTRRWAAEHGRYREDGAGGFMGYDIAVQMGLAFGEQSVPVRCALRAASHMIAVARLRQLFPERVHVFDYDEAAELSIVEWAKLSTWLTRDIPPQDVRKREHPGFEAEDAASISQISLKCDELVSKLDA